MDVTLTTDQTPLALLCLSCGQAMTPETGGYACPACGTTSGPVTR